jgi:hypothetical protein
MNISFSKLSSDRLARLAVRMSFPTENKRPTAALEGSVELNKQID